jgi:hypothetical protein
MLTAPYIPDIIGAQIKSLYPGGVGARCVAREWEAVG